MQFILSHHGRSFSIETHGFASSDGDPHDAVDHLAAWIEQHSEAQTGVLHTVLAETQDDRARAYRLPELDEAEAAAAEAVAVALREHRTSRGERVTLRADLPAPATTREARPTA